MREDFHQEQGALFGAAPAGAMMKKRAAHQERHDDFIPEVTVTKVSTLSYEHSYVHHKYVHILFLSAYSLFYSENTMCYA